GGDRHPPPSPLRAVGEAGGASGRRAAAVVDDDVDAAEGLDGRVHEPGQILEVANVPADREPSDPLGLLLEPLAVPSEHGDVGALACEALRARQPEAGGGAADDRRAALEP